MTQGSVAPDTLWIKLVGSYYNAKFTVELAEATGGDDSGHDIRAVIGEQHPDERITFRAEKGDGRGLPVEELDHPTVLVMGTETLDQFKSNSELWRRVASVEDTRKD